MDASGELFEVSDLKRLHDGRDILRKWKERTPLNQCMYWQTKCGRPIGSHLIPRAWLEQIQRNRHVVQFRITDERAGKKPVIVEATETGINETTVFPGFCAEHDNLIFRDIDRVDLVPSPRSALLLAYRSVCCEACAKHQTTSAQVEIGMLDDLSRPHHVVVFANMMICLDLLRLKGRIEELLDGHREHEFSHVVLELDRPPQISVAVTFRPTATFTGRALQSRREFISFAVFPSGSGGFAVFSWDSRAGKNPDLFAKSILKTPLKKLSVLLFDLIFDVSENFAMSPDFWESLPKRTQDALRHRFGRNILRPGEALTESGEHFVRNLNVAAPYAMGVHRVYRLN